MLPLKRQQPQKVFVFSPQLAGARTSLPCRKVLQPVENQDCWPVEVPEASIPAAQLVAQTTVVAETALHRVRKNLFHVDESGGEVKGSIGEDSPLAEKLHSQLWKARAAVALKRLESSSLGRYRPPSQAQPTETENGMGLSARWSLDSGQRGPGSGSFQVDRNREIANTQLHRGQRGSGSFQVDRNREIANTQRDSGQHSAGSGSFQVDRNREITNTQLDRVSSYPLELEQPGLKPTGLNSVWCRDIFDQCARYARHPDASLENILPHSESLLVRPHFYLKKTCAFLVNSVIIHS